MLIYSCVQGFWNILHGLIFGKRSNIREFAKFYARKVFISHSGHRDVILYTHIWPLRQK